MLHTTLGTLGGEHHALADASACDAPDHEQRIRVFVDDELEVMAESDRDKAPTRAASPAGTADRRARTPPPAPATSAR